MTRAERKKVIDDMYRTMADELESHLDNGSGFIFLNNLDEAEREDVVDLRVKVLRQTVAALKKGHTR